jgi:hypothetical protein
MPSKIDPREPIKGNIFPQTPPDKNIDADNFTGSISSDSAEGKALLRVSAIQKGEPVEWVVIESDESTDMQTVRERIQKRGYKVSTKHSSQSHC